MLRTLTLSLFSLAVFCSSLLAEDKLPLLFQDSFDNGMNAWQPTDAKKWTVDKLDDGNHVLHLHGKSNYEPPHRSPHSIVFLKDTFVSDFVLTAKVKTLQTSRGHRDMCVFFGYQDPANFYYVHLGEKTDDHANQIFIVNDSPRTKISEITNKGTPWKDGVWHQVKVVRKVETGLIEIYFDDMKTPQIVSHNKEYLWGQVGLGSFDDLGLWDDVQLNGHKISPPSDSQKSVKKK